MPVFVTVKVTVTVKLVGLVAVPPGVVTLSGPVVAPAGSPVSLYVMPATVATWAKPVHPLPWHRSTRYPVTPTSSVEAVHARLIWLLLTAVAVGFDGAVGGLVSGVPPAVSPPSQPVKVNAGGYASIPTSPGA